MEGRERSVEYYTTAAGVCPFREWRMAQSRDRRTKAAIDARITRFRTGNFGDSKPIGDGVAESRIHFGPGYRVYYGVDGNKIVLLTGGDKSTQDADSRLARKYWADYKEQKELWKKEN